MDQLYYNIMQQKTNKELVRLVHYDRNNFHHEGVAVAEEEIVRRAIPQQEIETLKIEIVMDLQKEKAIENEPLEFKYKILTLLLPGVIPFMLSKNYEENGQVAKARQLRKWSSYGFIFYAVLLISLLFIAKKG